MADKDLGQTIAKIFGLGEEFFDGKDLENFAAGGSALPYTIKEHQLELIEKMKKGRNGFSCGAISNINAHQTQDLNGVLSKYYIQKIDPLSYNLSLEPFDDIRSIFFDRDMLPLIDPSDLKHQENIRRFLDVSTSHVELHNRGHSIITASILSDEVTTDGQECMLEYEALLLSNYHDRVFEFCHIPKVPFSYSKIAVYLALYTGHTNLR